MSKNTDSGASAEHAEQDGKQVVFCTIYKEDRKFVNETKGPQNREERLHDIIAFYRKVTWL